MRSRVIAAGLLAAVAVLVGVIVQSGADSYRIHARFVDAGLLVEGGQVKVAGRNVGKIEEIDIGPAGLADVTLALHGDEVVPLHTGTRATIRSLGPATITNRYVDLAPGSASAKALPDGGVLPTTQTAGIVNLDALLDTFDAGTRSNLQALLANSSKIFTGSGAATFNRMLARFAPATRDLGLVAGDLEADQTQLARLIRTANVAASAVASRRPDLRDAIDASGVWLGAVARQREALAATLQDAPAALHAGARTLARAQRTVDRLRPALRAVPAAARPLDDLIDQTRPALRGGAAAAEQVRAQLPDVRRAIDGLPPLARQAVPALEAAGAGMADLKPIFRGLRIYAPDFALGIINGLAGVSASNYGRFGHYARLEFIQNLQTTLGGSLAKLLTGGPLIPGITDVRAGLTDRCPGADAPPSPDGSSPIHVDGLCNPAHDTPALVNQPPGTPSKARKGR